MSDGKASHIDGLGINMQYVKDVIVERDADENKSGGASQETTALGRFFRKYLL